jgi:hypothetical protein
MRHYQISLLGSVDFRVGDRKGDEKGDRRLERALLVTVASRERSRSPDLIKRRNIPGRPCKTRRGVKCDANLKDPQ